MFISESTATGHVTPKRCTAAWTLARTFSKSNSGECTPTMTRPRLPYARSRCCRWGMVRTQLTQENVQKSTSTTLPRRPPTVSGWLLIQPSSPVNSAAPMRWSVGMSAALPVPVAALGGAVLASMVISTAATTTPARPVSAHRYRDMLVRVRGAGPWRPADVASRRGRGSSYPVSALSTVAYPEAVPWCYGAFDASAPERAGAGVQ